MTIRGQPDLVTQSIESADGRGGIQIVTSCVKVPLVDLQCRLCMASQSLCCKLARVFLVQEKNFPTSSMVEYHMTKKNRRMVKDQAVNFSNGCLK